MARSHKISIFRLAQDTDANIVSGVQDENDDGVAAALVSEICSEFCIIADH